MMPDEIQATPPPHASVYLRDVVYGAMDGAVTTFAVVSGVTGAGLSPSIVLVLGVAGVVGDGFSMAAGNYLGTKAESERIAGAGVDSYNNGSRPLAAALATFVAFLLAGAIPLVPYVLAACGMQFASPASISTTLTLVTFFLIGAGKTFIVPVRWWSAGLESLMVGSIAAALAYGCGQLLAGVA